MNFGTFQEQAIFNRPLPLIAGYASGATFKVISGKLPPGLNIVGSTITGTPYSVADVTVFTFCVRAASTTGEISDRTYSITIDGADAPEFVTPTGRLAIGTHQQMYVLDKTYINYQIEAFDLDTSAGQKLTYFISSGDGALPPGLTMSASGKISGFILPAVKIKPADGAGTYDDAYYDAAAFDFGLRTTNGFDSYIYDRVFYDYNLPNVLAAVAIGLYFKVPMGKIKSAIESYTPTNSRSQLVRWNNNEVILDAYNANPSSMKLTVENFVKLNKANKVVCLGGMRELGADTLIEHQMLIDQLKENNWSEVILVGAEFKDCNHNYPYFDTVQDAKTWLDSKQFSGHTLLIKGSRGIQMEQLIAP